MDVALSIDALVSGLGLAKQLSLARSHHHFALSDSAGDQSAPSASVLQISAAAAVAVKSQACRTLPRRLVRRRRRSKRRSLSGDCPDEGGDVGDSGFYGSDPFGGGFGPGGSGGGDGSGWNFGGPNWEDDSSSRFGSGSSFALDFVYEVICWIALSNCVHFAFKKMLRSLAVDGIGDAAREKVPIRLT